MTMIYYEQDGDLSVLQGQTVGIIGYNTMGRALAFNLRDSGVDVIIGLDESESYAIVEADDLVSRSYHGTVLNSSIILLMLSDEVLPQVYLEQISPHLQRGDTLIFTSGYCVAYAYIEPPPFVDVGLIAPRTFGPAVRERYLSGDGFYSFVAAGQDASGQIWDTILSLARAIGSLRAGAVEITMEQEAELDLFMQQAILPAFHHIMTTAAKLLLAMGYPPEAAMMDLYVSGELNDYMERAARNGMLHALRLPSLTGQFGIFSRLERFNELRLERLMEVTLEEIRSGQFSQEWAREYSNGYPRLRQLLRQQEEMDLWELEQQTIELLRNSSA